MAWHLKRQMVPSRTNLSQQDKTWVEFSTLEDAVFMIVTNHTIPTKRPNLGLKTRPIQETTLGCLQLDITFPGACTIKHYGLIIYGKLTDFVVS